MKLRLVGAVSACALVFLAYAPIVNAESFNLNRTTAAIPNELLVELLLKDGGEVHSAGIHVPSAPGGIGSPFSGGDDLETVNPFRPKKVTSGGAKGGSSGSTPPGLAQVQDFLLSQTLPVTLPALDFTLTQVGDMDGDGSNDFRLSLIIPGYAFAPVNGSGQPLPTPEPASLVLLGSGLAGLTAYRVRRRSRP